MQGLLGILAFLCMHSLFSQKPIFNQKSFPKFKIVDSLSGNDHALINKIAGLKKEKFSVITSRQKMPVFKPNYKSAMPVYAVDTASTYFIKSYPTTND